MHLGLTLPGTLQVPPWYRGYGYVVFKALETLELEVLGICSLFEVGCAGISRFRV